MRDLTLVSRRVSLRLAWLAATALSLTGCSESSRFADPLGNPFQTFDQVDRAPTGSVPVQRQANFERSSPAIQPIVSQPIVGQPLPAPSASGTPSFNNAPRPTVASQPIDPTPTASTHGGPAITSNNWTSHGGTPVVMAQGETPTVLADRYGVPVDALVRTNGFASASQISPGARLTIPVYSVGAGQGAPPPQRQATVEARPAPAAAAPSRETMRLVKGPAPVTPSAKIAHEAEKPLDKKAVGLARAKLLERGKIAKAPVEETPVRTAKAPVAPARQARLEEKPVTSRMAPAERPVAVAKPVQAEKVVAKAPPALEKPAVAEKRPNIDTAPTASLPAEAAKPEGAGPEFRWPARGRVIQGFKQGGNDGINISLPEGTAIKAAEEGTVAYAGSELKGYGNLVLIRHPNGFVSAYANNGSLDVKRGDTVKRGQTIAKSGQSGNVSAPQLHFELRKGAQPVDPSNYLANM